ncbi:hypothetical protein AMJ83_04370 [candidate division WOR_3 bacterium SM23_42]|uniref:peptidylprolyl isomerase n=1 Tax=candidate division WOR_3 bacterium SM23_42 TaxID=1703779 RepID=A0A0S8FTN8_UNCW3|nr:MAG: hypothetical protein AMJ83_04370 [candidate division WOR_3 bacterium SM23_42]
MQYLKYFLVPLFLLIVSCSFEGRTLVTINGEDYSVADFRDRFQFVPTDDSAKRSEKFDEFVNQMLVIEEAKNLGYEDDPVVRAAFETNRRDVIWRTYYNNVIKKRVKVRDSEVRDIYDKVVEQYHLAQIVVAEESLANHLSRELKKGASFEELMVFSLDTLSENGDIGTFSVISIPPEIMDELQMVKEGGVTEPVRFGEYYLIFKVVEHSIAEQPKYEDIKENIRQNLSQERAREEAEKYYNKVRERARVEYNPEGLEILIKPESLITDEDLNTWVVKKYDTSYVYVRTVINAVQYMRSGTMIDPQLLIDKELLPDLVYDEAIKNYHDKRPATKRQLDKTYSSLLYQKYYSDEVVERAVVDSVEVAEYYNTHRDEFKDKSLSEAFSLAKAHVREAKIDGLRSSLFKMLREKYKPEVNEKVLAQLLKEEK